MVEHRIPAVVDMACNHFQRHYHHLRPYCHDRRIVGAADRHQERRRTLGMVRSEGAPSAEMSRVLMGEDLWGVVEGMTDRELRMAVDFVDVVAAAVDFELAILRCRSIRMENSHWGPMADLEYVVHGSEEAPFVHVHRVSDPVDRNSSLCGYLPVNRTQMIPVLEDNEKEELHHM